MQLPKRLLDKARSLLSPQSYGGAIARLAGSTAVAQIIALAATPLLTRLYTPDDFGVLALYASIIAFMGLVATLRYDMAVPLARVERDAAALLLGIIGITIGITVTTAIVVRILHTYTTFGSSSAAGSLSWAIPLGIMWLGLNQSLTYWAVRNKRYTELSQTRITQAAGRVTVQLIGGFAGGGALGLVVGDIVGGASGCSRLASSAFPLLKKEIRTISLKHITAQLAQYRNFPLFTLPGNILNASSLQLIPIFLLTVFGSVAAGYFALTQRILLAPVSLIGTAVSQVYMAEAANLLTTDPSALPKLFRRTVLGLLAIASIPTIIIAAFGPQLFSFIFGANWTQSGILARALSCAFLAQMIVSPVSHTLNVLQQQSLGLAGDVIRVIGTLSIFWLAYDYSWTLTQTIITLSAFLSSSYFIYLYIYYRAVARVAHPDAAAAAQPTSTEK